MKLLKTLCLLTILTIPLGEVLRIYIGNDIAIRIQDIIVGFSALLFIGICIKEKKLPKSYLSKPLAIFIGLGFLSLIINSARLNPNQLLASSLYLPRWICYALIYFVVFRVGKKFKKNALTIIFLDGFIILLAGFIQYFLYPNLRNLYYLGWDEHNYRMFSVFFDPNFAGAFFVLFFLFLTGRIHFYVNNNKRRNAILMTTIAAVTVTAIFLTYSRSAIIMLAVGLGSYLVLINKKKFLLLLLGAIVLVVILLSPTFNKEGTNLFRKTSSMSRIETYSGALKIIQNHPLFGIGFNSYRYAQQAYGFRGVGTEFPSHADAGTDNSLLFVAATTGVFGLIAYLYLWFKILSHAFLIRKKENDILPIVVIASTIGLFADSFFINSLFFPAIMLWMWILIALMESY